MHTTKMSKQEINICKYFLCKQYNFSLSFTFICADLTSKSMPLVSNYLIKLNIFLFSCLHGVGSHKSFLCYFSYLCYWKSIFCICEIVSTIGQFGCQVWNIQYYHLCSIFQHSFLTLGQDQAWSIFFTHSAFLKQDSVFSCHNKTA
jgi:hypothetical protein